MVISNPDDERRRAEAELAQLNLREARRREAEAQRAESERERRDELERRRLEDEARQEERQRQSLGGRIQGVRDKANEVKDAFIGGATEFTLKTAKSSKFWLGFFVFLILLVIAWKNDWLRIREIVTGLGITFAGIIVIVIIFCFILWGWVTSAKNFSNFFIATALAIWMVDMLPLDWIPGIGPYFAIPWAGFEWPFGGWNIPWVSIIFSSFSFALLYIFMVFNIIEKEYLRFLLQFSFIIISNYVITRFFPDYVTLPNYSLHLPTWETALVNFGILLALVTLGFLAWKFDRRRTGAVPDFFSSLFLIFVFSFFWMYNGWQSNLRAILHFVFILFFGFFYIRPSESESPWIWRILIALLLIIDFFGYGALYRSDYLFLKFIPPIVLFVIIYCYHQETKPTRETGKRNYTYPAFAMALLVTFILIMSIKVSGLETDVSVPFIAKQGTTFKEFYSSFTDNLKELIEGRLDIATAGLYRGSVEKNRYESLGVYFANIRASDPRFYTDEPITVWSSIRSKTYKDPVIINFSCYRWKDNKRIYADKSVPEIKFPIFQLEEVDTECTFLPPNPAKPDEKAKEYAIGANTVTLSAEYNFATDSYLKTYFIDRDRFKSYSRETIEPLTEFGIKDKKPVAVHTNGPVEIGISAGPLVSVSSDYAVKPLVGITLTNRKEISDKDKRIIQKWDGKIKNITELVLLTPPGITLEGNDPEAMKACNLPKNEPERLKCPCNFAFKSYTVDDCFGSCTNNVVVPCTVTCSNVYRKDENARNSCIADCQNSFAVCNNECKNLFSTAEGEGNGKYNGYALDVGSLDFRDLNKDIDKHRTFVCRYNTDPSKLLDSTPLTTRYFRVRARYNYVAENSVTVNVEKPPVSAINVVPESISKIASEIGYGNALWFDGLTNELVSAIASVESKFKHCCQEQQSYEIGKKIPGVKCTPSSQKECDFNYLVTSGSSFGIMQVNYIGKNRVWVDSLAQNHCIDKNINDYDCNIKVGIAILKSKYTSFKDGCGKFSGIRNACNNCKSNRAPYKSYSDYRGVEAALRGYNGWGCPESGAKYGDASYVEKVLSAMKTVSGVQIIDPTTLGGITREGEGMYDATPSQTDEATGGSISTTAPSLVSNVQATYDFINKNNVRIRWGKPFSSDVISYRVTRTSDDVTTIICDQNAGAGSYLCTDRNGGKLFESGKEYTYTVYAYSSSGQYSESMTHLTIT